MRGDSFPDSDVLVIQDQRQITEPKQTTRIVGHGYQHRVGEGLGSENRSEAARMEIVATNQLIPILGTTQKERRGAIRIIVRSCDLVR